jgi:hypothetical protein
MEQDEMMSKKNWNCDGGHCTSPDGEVRVYPLGGGANLILCHTCFTHENSYRVSRGDLKKWPTVSWTAAKRYPELTLKIVKEE